MKLNLMLLRLFLSITMIVSVSACGGSSEDQTNNEAHGLIIFATEETHNGDFENDPNLSGGNWAEKADDFCNNASNKPNDSNYKALIVDGVTRDAVTLTDWVLEPDTEYYRIDGVTLIGQTNTDSIFDVYYGNLSNSIDEYGRDYPGTWTGIGDTSDFSVYGDTCNNWSTADSGIFSMNGYWHSTGNGAFSSTLVYCGAAEHIYCVEQMQNE